MKKKLIKVLLLLSISSKVYSQNTSIIDKPRDVALQAAVNIPGIEMIKLTKKKIIIIHPGLCIKLTYNFTDNTKYSDGNTLICYKTVMEFPSEALNDILQSLGNKVNLGTDKRHIYPNEYYTEFIVKCKFKDKYKLITKGIY